MRLLLLGATGRTGGQLLAQAIAQGHEVTALARDPGKVPTYRGSVRVLGGNVTDPAALRSALEGQDGVLCALGPSSPTALFRFQLMRGTVEALLPAMNAHRVSRLVMLSALGAGHSAKHAPVPARLMFRTLFRQVGKDKATAEGWLQDSELDWTVVYPPSLTNGDRTGDYRHGEALKVHGMPRISRADVAEFMLAQLADPSYSRKPAIVSPR